MIKIVTDLNTETGLATRISFLKVNEYEIYVDMVQPISPIQMAIMLKTLSDKIRWKENA